MSFQVVCGRSVDQDYAKEGESAAACNTASAAWAGRVRRK